MTQKRDIVLSPQHGVNPSLMQCYLCLKDMGVALCGKLPGDAEAPRHVTQQGWVCDECESFMKQGIILISVRDGETGDNPYRTGKFAVVRDRVFQNHPEILRRRVAFVEDKMWVEMGLGGDNQ